MDRTLTRADLNRRALTTYYVACLRYCLENGNRYGGELAIERAIARSAAEAAGFNEMVLGDVYRLARSTALTLGDAAILVAAEGSKA